MQYKLRPLSLVLAILKCPFIAPEWPGQIHDCGRMTRNPEVIETASRRLQYRRKLKCFFDRSNKQNLYDNCTIDWLV